MSKYMGEQLIQNIYSNHYILRTSWVYDDENSNNFPNKILKKYLEQKDITIVSDQKGSPTHVDLISYLTECLLEKYLKLTNDEREKSFGIYHLAANGKTSWYNFSKYIIERYCNLKKIKLCNNRIKECTSQEFKSIVSRPSNSVLDCTKLEKFLSLKIPSWQDYADKFIQRKI